MIVQLFLYIIIHVINDVIRGYMVIKCKTKIINIGPLSIKLLNLKFYHIQFYFYIIYLFGQHSFKLNSYRTFTILLGTY